MKHIKPEEKCYCGAAVYEKGQKCWRCHAQEAQLLNNRFIYGAHNPFFRSGYSHLGAGRGYKKNDHK